MKIKVSVSMERELHEKVKDKVAVSVFRNTSHLVEHAVESFLKEAQNE
ncbi:MAG: hypothetical protein ABH824_04100 [Nanoarchaeota archaeon]|nr:ribbon-helix-helix domain-containing protein [Nanoarchaeota archaeon]MBU1631987.1 ribbon-helix-helix domain-containing protein [Nanoarchaeota archaeon]MBU1876097.1 ribbon-helix-helix domain-containing protein [Nanoarchaeota archaeon]